MASSSSMSNGPREQVKPLPNRPEAKLPPIPKGARIHKRPLPIPATTTRLRRNAPAFSSSSLPGAFSTAADIDGYLPPPRASHTIVIKVSSSAAFMSLVRRVRKALDKAPRRQATRGLPLAARMEALKVARPSPSGPAAATAAVTSAAAAGGGMQDAVLDDVVLVATGRAIARVVEVAGFFTREQDLAVLVRTRTVRAVDDVLAAEDAGEEEAEDFEDQVRVRSVSCVEVGIRWLV
ncbi:hypothetical protein VTJ83DRAFT_1498 [Remersonia thermophila]|uniref:Uncharacterized protein n=1 Tax=Remersonia thermophila TaxID=72144 RepID=A0ABR4DGZ2_9PEZI